MFDLHLHILAGIDDGPQTRDESVAMLKLAGSLGFQTLVATPHLYDQITDVYLARIQTEFNWLNDQATKFGIQLNRGFEVRIAPDLGQRVLTGPTLTLASTRTILIELPFAGWPTYTERVVFDLLAAGFRPLLAHPERYEAAIDDPDRVLALHDRGVLMQLTTGSLAGLFGKRAKALGERLLKDDAIDILASDAHSAGRRFVAVNEGLARARELVGEDRVRQLTLDNPRALLADAELPESVARVQASSQDGNWLSKVRHLIPKR